MKRKLQIITLTMATAMALTFPADVSAAHKTDEPENYSITVKNNTVFPLKEISVVYNHDKEDQIKEIAPGEMEPLGIPEMDREVTEIKISGKITDKVTFTGTFIGLADNDTVLRIEQNEDFSFSASSNMEKF